MSKRIQATLLLSGMIIGAGMFAIPFAFAAAGFWLGAAELALLCLAVLMLHLLYAEIVLATPEFHRAPGYMRIWLGDQAGALSWASTLFGVIGTLLAYLVVGSVFLHAIFLGIFPGAPFSGWAFALAGAVAFITYFPLRKEARINGILTYFEIGALFLFSLFIIRHADISHFAGIYPERAFVPYGILLFALTGGSVIPELVTLLGRDRKRVRQSIVIGTLLPALLYFLFAFAVVGVTGSATTPEAIAGLQKTLGGNITLFASIAGFLAVLTSFIALSENFQGLLRIDLGVPRVRAWVGASIIPMALYLAGFQNFITIISVVGVVAFGIDALLFFRAGAKVREKEGKKRTGSDLFLSVIVPIILVGVAVELARTLLF